MFTGAKELRLLDRLKSNLKLTTTAYNQRAVMLLLCHELGDDKSYIWQCGNMLFANGVFFFLRLLLRCIVIIDQTLTELCRSCRVFVCLRPRWAFGAAAQHNVHLTFWAFCADLVILPLVGAFFSTPLITPTATVWRMSRTANLPEEGWWGGKTQVIADSHYQ